MGALISISVGALISKFCVSDDAELEVPGAKSTFFGHSKSDGNLSRSLFQQEFSSSIIDHPHSC